MHRLVMTVIALSFIAAAGCDSPDFVIESGAGPDAGVLGDASPMGDAFVALADADGGSQADAYVDPGSDSGLGDTGADSGTPDDGGVDAWTMPSGPCGNGVLDPGEVCDPGVLYPDGGVHEQYAAQCPACTAVVSCPSPPPGGVLGGLVSGTGTPADNRCVYYVPTMPTPAFGRVLTWGSTAERDAYIAALRTIVATGSPASVSGTIDAQRQVMVPLTSCPGGGSAVCRASVPESMCVVNGAIARCMEWDWNAGPYAGTHVVGMPTSSGTPSPTMSLVYLTITAIDSTAHQTNGFASVFVVLDPPGAS